MELTAKLEMKAVRAAVPKLWVAAHWWVVGVISEGRESHSKFKLLHALSQIIQK